MTAAAVMLAIVVAAQSVVMALAMRLIRRQRTEIERLRADRDAHRQDADQKRAAAVLYKGVADALGNRVQFCLTNHKREDTDTCTKS